MKILFCPIFYFLSCFLFIGLTDARAQLSEITVEIDWTSWASDNKVEIYDPSGNLIFEACDPTNCQTTASNSSYSETFNLGCYADLNNYYFIALDAYGDGWNGSGDNVIITSGGSTVVDYELTSGSTSGQQFFNVSGGGTCPAIDAAIDAVSGVTSGCGLSSSEVITATVRNQGTLNLVSVPVMYQVNGSGYSSAGTIAGPIAPGQTVTLNFSVDLSSFSTYSIDVMVDYSGDVNAANDELAGYQVVNNQEHDFTTMGDYTMGFEAAEDVSGWSVLDNNNDAATWAFDNTTNPRTGSQAAAYTYSSVNAANDWMFSKCLYLESGQTYELDYYYRVRNAIYPESFAVRITSAQDNSSTISTIESFSNLTNTSYSLSQNTFSVVSTGTYYLAWEATSAADQWDLYIDDVTISKIVPIDAGIVSIDSPTDACGLTSSETVQVTIENFGTSAISNVPVEYSLNGAAYQSAGVYTGTITSGATATHTFSADFSTAMTHILDVRTQIAGDGISANDEFAGYTVTNESSNLQQSVLTMGFEPSEDFTTWHVLNANGDSRTWELSAQNPKTGAEGARIRQSNSGLATDDWMFSPCLYLEVGENYVVDFSYRARNNSFTESMDVYLTSSPDAVSTVSTIATYPSFNSNSYIDESIVFTVASTGTYYLAWQGNSAASQRGIFIDDVSIYNQKTFWLGYSNDWNDAANWSRGEPMANSESVIPSSPIGGNMPLISDTGHVGDLTIEAGNSISFGVDGALSVSGDYSGSATFTDGALIFNGASNQVIQGSNTFFNLIIDNPSGVDISTGDQNIRSVLTLDDGALNLNGNAFVIKSDAVGDGRIGPVVNGSINGNVTVQRYVDAGETNWRFLCSPIQNADFEQWDDDFITSGFPGSNYPSFNFTSIYSYDESVTGNLDFGFVPLASSSEIISPGEGFWVWCGDNGSGTSPFTIDVVGPILTGDVSLNVSYTNTGSPDDDGWSMAGNPYVSEIDWDAAGWTKSNMNNAVYVWDPDSSRYTSYVGGVGTNGGTRYIASSQAFWVQANDTTPALIASESVKSGTGKSFVWETNEKTPLVRLSVSGAGSGASDEMALRFADNATPGFDKYFDAQKIYNAGYVNISSFSPDSSGYSINAQPKITEDLSIPIEVLVPTNGTYQISLLEISDFSSTSCLFLEDLVTGGVHNLNAFESFSVYMDATYTEPRFLLHITAPIEHTVIDATCHGEDNGQVEFSAVKTGEWSVLVKNSEQLIVDSASTLSDSVNFSNLAEGLYFVTIESNGLCPVVRDSFRIQAPAEIVPAFSIPMYVEIGEPAAFTNETAGATTYKWSFGDGSASSEEEPSHAYKTPGIYKVQLTAFNVNDCAETAIHDLQVHDPTGVSPITEVSPSIKLFSNGNDVKLIFDLPEASNVELEVLNVIGKTVQSLAFDGIQTEERWLDLTNLSGGVYLLKVQHGGVKETFQFFLY